MKNKNYSLFYIVLGISLILTGCTGEEVTSTDTAVVTEPESGGFTLKAILTEVPDLPEVDLFVETVVAPEPEKKIEIIKRYEDFSSAVYADLKGSAPFGLFFTREECERCDQIDNFLSRNLSVLPNETQILKVLWDEYPNLQTDLGARRPATMVFFGADGEVSDSLFAPPIDRITDFFVENQSK